LNEAVVISSFAEAREVYRERFTAARFQASLAAVYCELGFEPR